MIDDKLIRQLNSPNVEQRKQAIAALAKSKDRDALSYLSNVFRSDADPEVRELARKAGIYINKNSPQSGGAGVVGGGGNGGGNGSEKAKTTYAYDAVDEEEDDGYASAYGQYNDLYDDGADDDVDDDGGDEADYEDVKVTPLDEERANGLVQQALDIHMRGNNDKAIKYLSQAFAKNPGLKRDSYTMSLAATVTGLPGSQAIAYIMEGSGGGKAKAKRGEKAKAASAVPGEITWGDAFVDLAIYWLVNMGIAAVGSILALLALNDLMQTLSSSSPSSTSTTLFDPQSIVTFMQTLAVPVLLFYSAVLATMFLILLLIQYVAIHFVSLGMLGGDGTMPELIRKLSLLVTFGTPIYLVVSFFLSIMLPLYQPQSAEVALLVNFALPFVLCFFMAQRIGAAYRFGSMRGCAALIISSIALFMCSCAISYAITSSMASQLDPASFTF